MYNKLLAVLILSFTIPFLQHCAADGSPAATTEEETIHNPLFNAKTANIQFPSHEMVVHMDMLKLVPYNLSGCGKSVKLVVADSRLYVQNGTITNFETVGKAQAVYASLPSQFDLSLLRQKDNPSAAFTFSPGTWYWAYWTYDHAGELICSSPQYFSMDCAAAASLLRTLLRGNI